MRQMMATKAGKALDSGESVVTTTLSLANWLTLVSIGLSVHFYYLNMWLVTELQFEVVNLNKTRLAEEEVLFFNRVPKVGSQTIMDLLKQLQYRNNFTHFVDSAEIKKTQGERTFLDKAMLQTYADMFVRNFTPPVSYTKHISFIDFKEFGPDYYHPIYINFVREPVQRIISWYYYIRAPWYLFVVGSGNASEFTAFKPGFNNSPTRYKTSFEECVAAGLKECTFISGHDHVMQGEGGSHASQMMFFCGHKRHCRVINGLQAFRDAKANVEKYYAVVGILEEMSKSLHVMERFVPRFFAGAPTIYERRNDKQKHINKNIYRPNVSDSVKDMVKKNISREIEFYHFCRQRLHKQYLSVGL